MQKMSLQALAREQHELAAGASSGRSARTVWGGHEHVLRQTVIALTANSAMSEHENPGEATVQVISGRVRLDAGGNHWEGRQGDLLFMPPGRHSLLALEDAVVLLTVAKTGQL
ncbi:MAG: cupin domain-containing protein [Nakamurella sp.]